MKDPTSTVFKPCQTLLSLFMMTGNGFKTIWIGMELNTKWNHVPYLYFHFLLFLSKTLCPNFLFYSYEAYIIKQLVWRCHSVTPTLFLFYHIFFFTENFWRVIGNSFSVCALFPIYNSNVCIYLICSFLFVASNVTLNLVAFYYRLDTHNTSME